MLYGQVMNRKAYCIRSGADRHIRSDPHIRSDGRVVVGSWTIAIVDETGTGYG
jgi:hypothetical protein